MANPENIITDTELKTVADTCPLDAMVGLHRLPDPIYNEDGITLYCADCTRVLPLLEPTAVNLVVTSPPYNLGNNHHTNKKRHNPYDDDMPEPEYQLWQTKILDGLYRVM
jgi:hypothetical protein